MNKKALFGANLKNERMKRGYSQADLSRLTGMPTSCWLYYETGQSFPKPENVSKILALFDVDMDYMLQDRGNDIDIGEKEKKIFAENLKNERIKKGYTQGEMSKIAGICRVSLNRYEVGLAFPRIENIPKLLKALDVDINYMLMAHKENLFTGRARGMNEVNIEMFARNLKQERIKKGYTQIALSKRTGISNAIISAYETGRLFPTSEKLNVLAETLGVKVDFLLIERECPDVITREDKENFSCSLKRERLKKRYTIEDLSKKTGIALNTISQYENGVFYPGLNKMLELAKALEVDLRYMLENRDYDTTTRSTYARETTVNGKTRSITKKDRENFARNLKQERIKKGYSQKMLSEKTGIRIQVISYFEVGRFFPCDDKMYKLLKALEVDIDYMLEDRPSARKKREAFAFNLWKARLVKGYSMKELSEKVGVSMESIRRYEGGRSIPKNETLSKLLEVLEIDFDYVFENQPDDEITTNERKALKEAFARNLRKERLGRGYTQKELAEKAGINQRTVHCYDNGRSFPEASHMAKILNVLDVTLDYMLRQ